jgi:hypothetical protein
MFDLAPMRPGKRAYCEAELQGSSPAVLLALELRLVSDFDVVALICTRNDEDWIVDATFVLQLLAVKVLAATPQPFGLEGQNDRTDFKLAACQPRNSAPP